MQGVISLSITNDEENNFLIVIFMLYNMYLRFRFANPNIYTTFAGVNSKDMNVMKKVVILMCICATALMFGSCEPVEIENDLAGKRFTMHDGVGGSYDLFFDWYSYEVTMYYYIRGKYYSFTHYYTYENKIILIYYDEDKTKLLHRGEYRGDCIILDGDENFPYIYNDGSPLTAEELWDLIFG